MFYEAADVWVDLKLKSRTTYLFKMLRSHIQTTPITLPSKTVIQLIMHLGTIECRLDGF